MNSTDPIIIHLPGVPQGKGRPRMAVRGGFASMYQPKQTADYEKALKWVAREAMGGRPPLQGPLSVRMVATFPIPKSWPKGRIEAAWLHGEPHIGKIDLDNLIKVLDAFNGQPSRKGKDPIPGIVWDDDSQVVSITAKKRWGLNPGLTIEVKPYKD